MYLEAHGSSAGHVGAVLVRVVDCGAVQVGVSRLCGVPNVKCVRSLTVGPGVVVADDKAIKGPLFTQDLIEQTRLATGGDTIDGVVAACSWWT